MAYYAVEPFAPIEAVIGQVLAGLSGSKPAAQIKKQSPQQIKETLGMIFGGSGVIKKSRGIHVGD